MKNILLFIAATLSALLFAVSAFAQTNATTEYKAGLDLYKQAAYQTALPKFKNSIDMKPNADAYFMQGMCFKKLNQTQDAIAAFEFALALAPTHSNAVTQLAILNYNLQKYAEATTYFTRAVALNPNDAELQTFLQKSKAKSGSNTAINTTASVAAPAPKTATNDAQNTTTATAANANATSKVEHSKAFLQYANEGATAFRDKDYFSAVAAFKKATKEAPSEAKAYYNLGLAYANINGEEQNAIAALTKCTSLDRKHARAWHQLGQLYFKTGLGTSAQEAYEASLAAGTDKDLYAELATTYFFTQNFQKAINTFTIAHEKNPNDTEIHYGLGTAYLHAHQINAAAKTFREVIKNHPEHKEAQYNLANALLELEQYDEAKEIGETLTKLAPDYANGYLIIAVVYSKQGNTYEQEKYLRKAKKLDPSIAM